MSEAEEPASSPAKPDSDQAEPPQGEPSEPKVEPEEPPELKGADAREPDDVNASARATHPAVKVKTYARDGWEQVFIDSLAQIPVVAAACRLAEVSRGHVYARKAKDPDFAAAWTEALNNSLDRVEQAAFTAAVVGEERVYRTYRKDGTLASERVERITSHADRAMILKAHRPEMYRERVDIDVRKRPPKNVDEAIEDHVAELERMAKDGAKPLPSGPIIEADLVEPELGGDDGP